MTDKQCLALHHYLYLAQVVANQGRTAAHDVEDSIGQSDTRANLYATGNHVYLSIDMILGQEFLQDDGIGRGNGFAIEPLKTLVVDILGDSQRQTALAETQTRDDVGLGTLLYKFIFTYYANISHARGNALGNIVIAQIEYFQGEVGCLDQKRTLAGTYFDVGLTKQLHRVLEEATF